MENPYAIFQVKAVSNFQRFLLWLEIIILSQHKMGTLQLIQISLASNVDRKENIPHGNVSEIYVTEVRRMDIRL